MDTSAGNVSTQTLHSAGHSDTDPVLVTTWATEAAPSEGNVALIAALSAGAVTVVLIFVLFAVVCYRRRRQAQNKPDQQTGEAADPMLASDSRHVGNTENDPDLAPDPIEEPDLAHEPGNNPDLVHEPVNDPDLARIPETEVSDPEDILPGDGGGVEGGSDKTEETLTLRRELELVAPATQMRAQKMVERKDPPFDK